MNKKFRIALLATIAVAALAARNAEARRGRRPAPATRTTAATAALTDAEKTDLLLMREEEKLARDVYLLLLDRWNLRVFRNISWSEQRHMNAMLSLLDTYGLEDPAAAQVGVFNNPELKELYATLIESGQRSKLDALKVGALIEEVDIEDLEAAIARTTRPDIRRVYGNLLRGSRNHLRAFARNIEAITGQPYQAQWLPAAEVDEILGR